MLAARGRNAATLDRREASPSDGAMPWLLPDDENARARRDRWLGVLLGVLIVALALRAAQKEDGVLVRNQEFGARVLAGEDPYFDPARGHRVHGPYPPTYAWVTAPLALLPTPVARVAWALLQGAALVAAYRLLRSLAQRLAGDVAAHAPVWFACAVLLVSRYLLRDTSGGGGNLIYATLVLAALASAERGFEARAGWLFALPLVLKPNVAPFALFLAATRRWRTLAWSALAVAVLWLVPGVLFGLRAWSELSVRWAGDAYTFATLEDLHDDAAVPDGLPRNESSMNQALRAALDRLLRPSGTSAIDDVHVADLDANTVAWLARAGAFALLAVATLAAARANGERARWWAAGAFFPACLLASPITWKAHHTALLPLAFALVAAAHAKKSRALAVGLALYWLACGVASEEVLGKQAKNLLQAISVVTWFDVALFVLAVGLAHRASRAESTVSAARAHSRGRPSTSSRTKAPTSASEASIRAASPTTSTQSSSARTCRTASEPRSALVARSSHASRWSG